LLSFLLSFLFIVSALKLCCFSPVSSTSPSSRRKDGKKEGRKKGGRGEREGGRRKEEGGRRKEEGGRRTEGRHSFLYCTLTH
jgi:hypothetical protein